MRRFMISAAAAASLASMPATAATVIVAAQANSSAGGTAAIGPVIAAGHKFKITSSTNDLWSAGALPRYSDADGLKADRFTDGTSDDSGQTAGTKIGQNFGLYTVGSFSAYYGQLVGNFGGNFQTLGANGIFTAPTSGPLNLYYWDSNAGDNFGSITFDVSAVPEPAAWGLMILGMGAIGATMRRRRVAGRVAFA